MITRKLRAVSPVGSGFCSVVIPKTWVDEMGLKPSMVVTMERKGKSIIMTPMVK